MIIKASKNNSKSLKVNIKAGICYIRPICHLLLLALVY